MQSQTKWSMICNQQRFDEIFALLFIHLYNQCRWNSFEQLNFYFSKPSIFNLANIKQDVFFFKFKILIRSKKKQFDRFDWLDLPPTPIMFDDRNIQCCTSVLTKSNRNSNQRLPEFEWRFVRLRSFKASNGFDRSATSWRPHEGGGPRVQESNRNLPHAATSSMQRHLDISTIICFFTSSLSCLPVHLLSSFTFLRHSFSFRPFFFQTTKKKKWRQTFRASFLVISFYANLIDVFKR